MAVVNRSTCWHVDPPVTCRQSLGRTLALGLTRDLPYLTAFTAPFVLGSCASAMLRFGGDSACRAGVGPAGQPRRLTFMRKDRRLSTGDGVPPYERPNWLMTPTRITGQGSRERMVGMSREPYPEQRICQRGSLIERFAWLVMRSDRISAVELRSLSRRFLIRSDELDLDAEMRGSSRIEMRRRRPAIGRRGHACHANPRSFSRCSRGGLGGSKQ